MSNIGSYESRLHGFSWEEAKRVLDWKPGDTLNIGHVCTDRVCARGGAARPALIWEGFGGKRRTYTFDDLRVSTNAFASVLTDHGIRPGERVPIVNPCSAARSTMGAGQPWVEAVARKVL